MPGCPSWNGKWSGEGRNYVIVRSYRGDKATKNASSILSQGYFRYNWSDGWAAGITVEEVDSKKAAQLRKKSAGFNEYDWMVNTIEKYGKPLANHEIPKINT